MTTALEAAIELLAKKITADVKPDDALNFAKAALKLVHALATLKNIDSE